MRRLCLALLLSASAMYAQTYTESVIHSFSGAASDGITPLGLIQASDGNFYGTTSASSETLIKRPYGANAKQHATANASSDYYGTIFRLTPAGTITTLYTFCQAGGSCTDGSAPIGGLVQAPDGNLYGTTDDGGATGYGTIFQISLAGAFKTIYSFCPLANDDCPDGANPYAPLVVGSDGNLYGSNQNFGSSFGGGSAAVGGTVFKLTLPTATTAAKLTTVTYLCQQTSDFTCQDGSNPEGGLLETADGTFYGDTSEGGGTNEGGTIFKVTSTGGYSTVYTFCSVGGQFVCTDGSNPESALIEGSNGELYGSASNYGTESGGTIFSLVPGGSPVTLHNFCSETDCADGYFPKAVLFGTDGLLYGVVASGGSQAEDAGTLVKFSSTGAFSVIYTFCNAGNSACPDGSGPLRFIQGADGNFYGTASGGGANGDGAIYKLAPSTAPVAPVRVSLNSSSAAAGAQVTATYEIAAAYSVTLQQCYAYATLTSNNTVTALGKLSPAFSGGSATGTLPFTVPSTPGNYVVGVMCAGTQSGTAALTVNSSSKVGTVTTFVASPNPASIGQPVTLTATVKKSSGSGVPTGTVTFAYGSLVLGTPSLNTSGVASISASSAGLPPGSYPVTATYSGDANDDSSVGTTSETLKQDTTTTVLTASPNPVTRPASVTLTATVSHAGIAGTPTGTVTFLYGSVTLGTGTLNSSGVATLSASSGGQAAGSYAITAKYGGDTADAGSTSSPVTVVVH